MWARTAMCCFWSRTMLFCCLKMCIVCCQALSAVSEIMAAVGSIHRALSSCEWMRGILAPMLSSQHISTTHSLPLKLLRKHTCLPCNRTASSLWPTLMLPKQQTKNSHQQQPDTELNHLASLPTTNTATSPQPSSHNLHHNPHHTRHEEVQGCRP